MKFSLTPYDRRIRLCIFILSGCPLAWLAYGLSYNNLGVNPFETLMAVSGHSAFILLLLTLTMTPLRRWCIWSLKKCHSIRWGKRISDWNTLIRLRRMLGVYSFVYASVHLWTYLDLELSWLWDEFLWEISSRHFLILGGISWCILLLLTITSPKKVQKKMRKWWRTTHRLAYPLSVLLCLHFLWAVKETNIQPYYYFFVTVILLGHRLLAAYLPDLKRINDTGMETKR